MKLYDRVFVKSDKEITYEGYLSVRKIYPEYRQDVICDKVEEQQNKFILSEDELREIIGNVFDEMQFNAKTKEEFLDEFIQSKINQQNKQHG